MKLGIKLGMKLGIKLGVKIGVQSGLELGLEWGKNKFSFHHIKCKWWYLQSEKLYILIFSDF